jgi:hypothetical protein
VGFHGDNLAFGVEDSGTAGAIPGTISAILALGIRPSKAKYTRSDGKDRVLTPERAVAVITRFLSRVVAMDTRYVISALIGVFCVFAIFAAITTARHLSLRESAPATVKAKQSRPAEYNRLTALPIVDSDCGNYPVV